MLSAYSAWNQRMQVLKLEAMLKLEKSEKEQLQKDLDKVKETAADAAKKDTLRFQILLDMFGLHLLQTAQGEEVEQAVKAMPNSKSPSSPALAAM